MIALPNPTKILYTELSSDNDMTTTFAEYVASADAREQIATNVEKWTTMLCEALEQDFVRDSIRRAEFFLSNDPKYQAKRLEAIKNGEDMYKFTIDTGRKYHKVMMTTDGNSRSVHCFVDKKTGEVYKAASYKAPAKGVRFDLRLIEQREWLLENADWAGSYLYVR